MVYGYWLTNMVNTVAVAQIMFVGLGSRSTNMWNMLVVFFTHQRKCQQSQMEIGGSWIFCQWYAN